MDSKLVQLLVKEIRLFFSRAKKKKAVLGLSGGIDSALCAVLLVKALGKKNVSALLLPFEGISSEQNQSDAKNLSKKLGIARFTVKINEFAEQYSGLPWKQPDAAKANLLARVRATVLYNFANSTNSLVCGTGNKSEILLGYFTKYGDAAADFFPIGGLYKTEVRQLALQVGLPKAFLEKAPTAELCAGQTDEGEIGVKYTEIDPILLHVVKGGKTKQQIIALGFPKKAVERVFSLMAANKHKREQPPILKTSAKQPYT